MVGRIALAEDEGHHRARRDRWARDLAPVRIGDKLRVGVVLRRRQEPPLDVPRDAEHLVAPAAGMHADQQAGNARRRDGGNEGDPANQFFTLPVIMRARRWRTRWSATI